LPPPLEIEVKLGLASQAAHDALLRALGSGARTLWQRNAFFDGPRHEVSAARIALRAREERTAEASGASVRTFLTLKRGGSQSGAVHERIEWEEEIPTPLDDVVADPSRLLSLPAAPMRELLRLVPHLVALVCLGGFENERKEVPVQLEVADAAGRSVTVATLWEVDRTAFRGGPVEYELEVELPPAAKAADLTAESFAAAVRSRLTVLGVPWQPQPLSKYARFRSYCLGVKE
jgi:hypothetical protein